MRTIRIVVILALFMSVAPRAGAKASTQSPDSTLTTPRVEWKLATLSPEARKSIHVSAKDVPSFPNEDPRLRDPKAWPTTTRIGGAICSLRVGGGPVGLHSLYYQSAPWKGLQSKRGPYYFWRSLGSGEWLTERSWVVRDSRQTHIDTYQYYHTGELIRYQRTRSSGQPLLFFQHRRSEGLDEVFARNGCLVASAYWVDGKLVGCYYLGGQVGYQEYLDRTGELIMRANAAAMRPSTK